MEKPCPFWPDERQCASKECSIGYCDEDVPHGLKTSLRKDGPAQAIASAPTVRSSASAQSPVAVEEGGKDAEVERPKGQALGDGGGGGRPATCPNNFSRPSQIESSDYDDVAEGIKDNPAQGACEGSNRECWRRPL